MHEQGDRQLLSDLSDDELIINCTSRTNTGADSNPDTAGVALQIPPPPSTSCRQRRPTQQQSRTWLYRPGSRREGRPRANWCSPSSSWPIASAMDGAFLRIRSLQSRCVFADLSPSFSDQQHVWLVWLLTTSPIQSTNSAFRSTMKRPRILATVVCDLIRSGGRCRLWLARWRGAQRVQDADRMCLSRCRRDERGRLVLSRGIWDEERQG
jgi:hypothetical protein